MSHILIVEDEKEWHLPMSMNLHELAGGALQDYPAATSTSAALDMVRSRAWRVLSLDMRMPGHPRGEIDVRNGLLLIRRPDIMRLPIKAVAYSVTLDVEHFVTERQDARLVTELPVEDKYAKGGDDVPRSKEVPFEVMRTYSWAQRMLRYLNEERSTFKVGDDELKSANGAWLQRAPQVLPPLLARLAQNMANDWDTPGGNRVDAGSRLVEVSAALALAQCALLIAADAERAKATPASLQKLRQEVASRLPADARHASTLRSLGQLRQDFREVLARWNWSGWMTDEVQSAMELAHKLRNARSHSRQPLQPGVHWKELYPALRLVMDLCSYWALHPLCASLRYSREGWRGQLLASTAWPAPTTALEVEADFPGEATRDDGHHWQCVCWRPEAGQPWQMVPLNWSDWLVSEEAERAVWLRLWQYAPGDRNTGTWIDIVSGRARGKV